jgi:hypothetical protein
MIIILLKMCYKKILAVSICCFCRPEAEFNLAQHCSPLSGRKCANILCEWGCLRDNNNDTEIRWNFFQQLVKWQDSTGLHAANKITQRHLRFKSEKMKVKLAVQLLSDSVAHRQLNYSKTLQSHIIMLE